MAKIDPKSIIAGISGKLSKKDDTVFYHKWGKTYAWKNKGVHTFSPAQLANQTRFCLVSKAFNDLMENPELAEELAAYRAAYAASTGYCRFRGFVISKMMQELKGS